MAVIGYPFSFFPWHLGVSREKFALPSFLASGMQVA